MPRTVPSQVVAYFDQVFPNINQITYALLEQEVGALAGLLELYDALQPELIRLPPAKYAELVSAVAAIRFRLDQYRLSRNPDMLRFVTHIVPKVRGLLAGLSDVATVKEGTSNSSPILTCGN